ncbi:DNA alkylation repair protein [Enemella dayhoffiae]|uniref:DNA alkylation repair protein n=1 Tax=Enemella dayhoffiae TaxID=2016507 RepID=UPI0015956AD9|nr:DNA alkylation repair protein [Enemella dayhoffiae]
MVQLGHAIRAELAAAADPARAESMRAYLKSELPCHGIGNAAVRKLVAARLRGVALSAAEWERLIRELWDGAEYREERFAALSVARARARAYRRYAERPESLALYEYLIRTGAWWDLVDETAHLVEGVLVAHPEAAAAVLRRWAVDPDVWVRRVAITAQLHRGAGTDLALLADAIAGSVDDPDFFARKAIGWALRQYARTDPDWVRGYLAAHPELSPLSIREASKHL